MPSQIVTQVTVSGMPNVPAGVIDTVFNALLVNDTAAHNGQTFNTDFVTLLQYQCTWSGGSGSPAGTFKAQESNDGGVNWVDIASATATVSGNSGSGMIKITDCAAALSRIVLTLSAGTITVTVRLIGKGI